MADPVDACTLLATEFLENSPIKLFVYDAKRPQSPHTVLCIEQSNNVRVKLVGGCDKWTKMFTSWALKNSNKEIVNHRPAENCTSVFVMTTAGQGDHSGHAWCSSITAYMFTPMNSKSHNKIFSLTTSCRHACCSVSFCIRRWTVRPIRLCRESSYVPMWP